jgi:hypothetical protein
MFTLNFNFVFIIKFSKIAPVQVLFSPEYLHRAGFFAENDLRGFLLQRKSHNDGAASYLSTLCGNGAPESSSSLYAGETCSA